MDSRGAGGEIPDPEWASYIKAMEGFANEGGMFAEQLWDAPDLPNGSMKLGEPIGSAMPLCWSHAEYLTLVRSHLDGTVYDRIEPVYQRYVESETKNNFDIWTLAHHPRQIAADKPLRIILGEPAIIRWTADNWHSHQDSLTEETTIGLHFADLPANDLGSGSELIFKLKYEGSDQWEQKKFKVKVG